MAACLLHHLTNTIFISGDGPRAVMLRLPTRPNLDMLVPRMNGRPNRCLSRRFRGIRAEGKGL